MNKQIEQKKNNIDYLKIIKEQIEYLMATEIDQDENISDAIIYDLAKLHSDLSIFFKARELYER